MTDITSLGRSPARRSGARGSREYYFYFAIVLLFALPISLAIWVVSLTGLVRRPEKGPLGAAWEQANLVTPKIFWA